MADNSFNIFEAAGGSFLLRPASIFDSSSASSSTKKEKGKQMKTKFYFLISLFPALLQPHFGVSLVKFWSILFENRKFSMNYSKDKNPKDTRLFPKCSSSLQISVLNSRKLSLRIFSFKIMTWNFVSS